MAPKQEEIPGTESPDRDPELHALGLELLSLEEETKQAKAKEKGKREESGNALRKRGLTEYKVDGITLWLEPDTKVKVKRQGARKRGKIKKVTTAEPEP